MDKKRILVFDSGVGGLNAFAALNKRFLNCVFYYLSDKNGCPYGGKSVSQLLDLSLSLLKKHGADGFDGVVVACNTLSTTVLPLIKHELSPPVFGVFPPPTLKGKTLLVCTERTADSYYVKTCCQVYDVIPAKTLAADIEENIFSLENISLNFLPEGEYDNVALGCTHYLYLKRAFSRRYPKAVIYDGLDRLLTDFGRFAENGVFSVTTFCPPRVTTDDNFLGDDKVRNYAVFGKYFA